MAAVLYTDPGTSLLHFDGPNGSSSFPDAYGIAWSVATGSPVISTATSQFGGASLSLNGSSAIQTSTATSGLQPGASDWTFQGWVNLTSATGSNQTLISNWHNGSANLCSYICRVNPSGHLEMSYGVGGVNATFSGSSVTMPSGAWTHFAFVIKNGIVSFVIGGVFDATTGNLGGALNTNSGDVISIGGSDAGGPFSSFALGNFDEFKFSLTAEYTTNFTPPTVPFSLLSLNEPIDGVVSIATPANPSGIVVANELVDKFLSSSSVQSVGGVTARERSDRVLSVATLSSIGNASIREIFDRVAASSAVVANGHVNVKELSDYVASGGGSSSFNKELNDAIAGMLMAFLPRPALRVPAASGVLRVEA